jgi:ATP-dependent DNA helicase RecG
MHPSVDKLVKILRLEAERGHDNRAVVGGLDRMLDPWEQEARAGGVPEPILQLVRARLLDYAKLSPASREEALRGIWARLQAAFPEVREATPAQAGASDEPIAAQEARPSPPPAPSAAHPAPADDAPADLGFDADAEDALDDSWDEADDDTPAAPRPTAAAASTASTPAGLDAPLTVLSGIGPKSAENLARLGLHNLRDLLFYLPRRYDDYSQLKTINRLWYGEEVTIIASVESVHVRPVRGGRMKLVEVVVSDGTGSLRVNWFNQPWIADRLLPGRAVVLSGKVDQYLGRITMNSPEWEPIERQQLHTNRIVPVYALTSGVTAKWLRRVIHGLLGRYAPRLPDPLTESIRASAGVDALPIALQQIHFPDDQDHLRRAQERLAFQEMFLLQLGVLRQKREWDALACAPLPVADDWVEAFRARLPYALTAPQERAFEDVRADLAAPRPMNRLLQGDVGSGKTVVAAYAIGIACANGAQAALMAPTSILAEQHAVTVRGLLTECAGMPEDSIRLLIGATPEAEKREIRAGLVSGEIRVLIGTHALLEDPISFARLGLAVIDEQHRFGVEQRARLRSKGDNPNLLVMTATPIPRSLALTLYGDLDVSVLDEMPPGRKPVETRLLHRMERGRAHSFIRGQLQAGRQAFVIFPLVEGSEKVEALAAVDEYETLAKEAFSGLRVGLLHGRLKPDEKDEVMGRFRAGELDVLVSTSVVEVGVDIPNASVMMIEGANRFGLAQLHQFRGRVGRGEHASYCLLLPDADDEAADERLKAMESTNDGFRLAELDLEQRGPGDFLGTRQSGFAELRMARLTDIRLIEKARREATRLFQEDPLLQKPEHGLLAEELGGFWQTMKGDVS